MLTKRFRDHYDCIVLGDHKGALLSASLAAKLGLSVLVLPLGGRMGLRISDSGQCFDPESNFLMGLRNLVKSRGLLAECLSRIGATPSEEQLIRKDGVLPQVLTPNARVEFMLGDDELQFECNRELGKSGSSRLALVDVLRESESEFLKYWIKLPERLTWASGKSSAESAQKNRAPTEIKDLLAVLRKSASLSAQTKKNWLASGLKVSDYHRTPAGHGEFEELCQGLWYGAIGSNDWEIELSQLLHTLVLSRTGASFKGGMQAYRDFLLRIARRSGVHIAKAECRRIFVEKGRFMGVQVAQHGSMISAVGAVCGCPLDIVAERISVGGRAQSGKKLKASPVPSGWKFSVALTLHAEAIPPGMSKRLIWQERCAPPLEIELASPGDYGLREDDTVVLHIRTVLPFSEETLRPGYQILIATRMLRQVSAIIPFLEYHVTRIYPDFRKAHPALDSRIGATDPDSPELQSAVAEMREAFPFSTLAEVPANLRCYSGSGTGPRSGVEGLFIASEEAYPQLGSFGGTVAAIEAIAWLAHRSGLAGPLV